MRLCAVVAMSYTMQSQTEDERVSVGVIEDKPSSAPGPTGTAAELGLESEKVERLLGPGMVCDLFPPSSAGGLSHKS